MPRTGATRRQGDSFSQAFLSRIQQGFRSNHTTFGTPDGRLTDRTISALGLTSQPFGPPGGQTPYFYNESLSNLLEELESCLGHAETLVILEGADESGKTCTVAQLMERFYDSGHVFLTRAAVGVRADSIVRSMLSAYRSTTPKTLSECTEQLIHHFAEHAELGATCVLVVEDIDRMAVAEVQALLAEIDQINSAIDEPLGVLFSSAEPAEALLENVQSRQINDGHVDAFAMPKLDVNEAASYIATRLAAAGYDGELPFDEREMRVISHSSNGLPGHVDRAAAHALDNQFNRAQFRALLLPAQWWRATSRRLSWVLAGLTMLILGLALGAWDAQPDTSGETLVKRLPLPDSLGAGAVAEAPTAIEARAATQTPELKTAQSRVEPIPLDTSPQATATETVASTDASDSVAGVAIAEQANEPATTAAEDDQSALIAAAPIDDTATADATAADTPTVEPIDSSVAPETAQAEAVDEVVAAPSESIATNTEAPDTVRVAQASEDANTPVAANTTPSDQADPSPGQRADAGTAAEALTPPQPSGDILGGVISGEQWIQRREPDRFTIQLLAGDNETALRTHATKHGMTSMSAVYRTLRNGQPWFALVHGEFVDSASAREAVASLPELWQENSPWIRKFGDIQRVME